MLCPAQSTNLALLQIKLEAETEQPELEHTYWAEASMTHEIHHFLGVKYSDG